MKTMKKVLHPFRDINLVELNHVEHNLHYCVGDIRYIQNVLNFNMDNEHPVSLELSCTVGDIYKTFVLLEGRIETDLYEENLKKLYKRVIEIRKNFNSAIKRMSTIDHRNAILAIELFKAHIEFCVGQLTTDNINIKRKKNGN